MINKAKLESYLNTFHLQFLIAVCGIFKKYNAEPELLSGSYTELYALKDKEKEAMAREKKNEKIREKNDEDRTRERLHSSMFNYLKSILYDDSDTRREAAQRIMDVVTAVGNPRKLAENAESALLTTLSNRLSSYGEDLDTTGARQHLTKLTESNNRFIVLEKECREIAADRILADAPSTTTIRKQVDPVYRSIIDTLNALIKVKGDAEYKNLITEMNVLIAKYN